MIMLVVQMKRGVQGGGTRQSGGIPVGMRETAGRWTACPAPPPVLRAMQESGSRAQSELSAVEQSTLHSRRGVRLACCLPLAASCHPG